MLCQTTSVTSSARAPAIAVLSREAIDAFVRRSDDGTIAAFVDAMLRGEQREVWCAVDLIRKAGSAPDQRARTPPSLPPHERPSDQAP